MLEIISKKPITWKTWTPTTAKDFPCMICRSELATIWLKCELNGVVRLNLAVCHRCTLKTPIEIMEVIKE